MKYCNMDIMLTKKDLSTLKTMFRNTETGIIAKVGEMIQKNTDDIVELITTGFNAQDAGHLINEL